MELPGRDRDGDASGWTERARRGAHAVGLLLILAAVGIAVAVAVPQAVGADNSFVVNSDSMSPSIEAGAVVFVSDTDPGSIRENDVITYRADGGEGTRITHRVVAVTQVDGERAFRTKGDANDSPDPNPVSPDQLVGKVAFHVPLVGYVIAFAGSRLGLITLVVIPAVLLAATELRDLLAETEQAGGGTVEPESAEEPSTDTGNDPAGDTR